MLWQTLLTRNTIKALKQWYEKITFNKSQGSIKNTPRAKCWCSVHRWNSCIHILHSSLLPDVPRPAAPTQFKITVTHTLSLKLEQGQTGSSESRFCLTIFSHYHWQQNIMSPVCRDVTCLWPSAPRSSLSLTILRLSTQYNRYSQLAAARWLAQPGLVSTPDCQLRCSDLGSHTNTRHSVVVRLQCHERFPRKEVFIFKIVRRTLHVGDKQIL